MSRPQISALIDQAATLTDRQAECCVCGRGVDRSIATERGEVCVRCAEAEPMLAVDAMPDPLGVMWLWLGLTRIGAATALPSTGRVSVVSRATAATTEVGDLVDGVQWCLAQWQEAV